MPFQQHVDHRVGHITKTRESDGGEDSRFPIDAFQGAKEVRLRHRDGMSRERVDSGALNRLV